MTAAFLRATTKGWIYCRDHAAECVQIVLKNGTALPENYQTWQMNEINKLIWPSTNGFMVLTPAMFQQTADILLKYGVIKAAATPSSYDMSYLERLRRRCRKATSSGTTSCPSTSIPPCSSPRS